MSAVDELLNAFSAPVTFWENPSTHARQKLSASLTAAFSKVKRLPGTEIQALEMLADIERMSEAIVIHMSPEGRLSISGNHADTYRKLLRGTTWHEPVEHLDEQIIAALLPAEYL